MEPDGDPEARIRDLERPLAQQAFASELGTRPYESDPSMGTPVPPLRYEDHPQNTRATQSWTSPVDAGPYWSPPAGPSHHGSPQFGPPYYAPPRYATDKSSRLLWLIPIALFGVIVVAVVALSIYFATDGSGPSSTHKPLSPNTSGGGGPLGPPQEDPREPLSPGTNDVDIVESGHSLSIGGIEDDRSVICVDGSVSISGVRNTIDIQGECALVTVSGFENVVTIESARTISASGFDNQVTYSVGTPEISNSGIDNVVEQG